VCREPGRHDADGRRAAGGRTRGGGQTPDQPTRRSGGDLRHRVQLRRPGRARAASAALGRRHRTRPRRLVHPGRESDQRRNRPSERARRRGHPHRPMRGRFPEGHR
jgi:hypothetical protein